MEVLRSKKFTMRVEDVAGQSFEAHGRRINAFDLVVKIKFPKIGMVGSVHFLRPLIPN
jgi:hypothetical protein